MVLMGYHVYVSAQSKNVVDAVFEKVAKWARENRPQWIEEGGLCRVGANTVGEALFKELNRHWNCAGDDDDNLDGLISSVSTCNIPDCAAYKIAKYARSNPTEESSLTYIKYVDARAEQKRRFSTRQSKVSGATMSRGSAIRELMKACIGKPRLVAATSAASQREVIQRILGLSDVGKYDMVLFDEALQATEASLMLILTTEWFIDVGLAVLSGDHLQLPPIVKSKGESRVGNTLEISPLERSIKAYHDSRVVDFVHDYSSHLRICHTASTVTSGICSD